MLPLAVLKAGGLSNLSEPYLNDKFTVAFLSKDLADHKTLRQVDKLADELNKVVASARRLGIPWEQMVHVRIWEDSSFPVSDLWRSCGLEPDETQFAIMKKQIEELYAISVVSELQMLEQKLKERYPFLLYFPSPSCLSSTEVQLYEGDKFKEEQEFINSFIETLKETINKPLRDVQNHYFFTSESSYSSANCNIWVGRESRDYNLHRDYDVIIHEVGHHLFSQLSSEAVKKNLPERPFANTTLHYLFKPLLAFNEFFADYTAVANGRNMTISVLSPDFSLPEEFKRSFSRKRTLSQFMSDADDAGFQKYFFEECHNILNPTRYFIWRLRLDLDGETADKLVLSAARNWISNFVKVDINEYERVEDQYNPGSFLLIDYPSDIASINLRFLKEIQTAASFLDTEQKVIFNRAVEEVYGQ